MTHRAPSSARITKRVCRYCKREVSMSFVSLAAHVVNPRMEDSPICRGSGSIPADKVGYWERFHQTGPKNGHQAGPRPEDEEESA